MPKTDRDGNDIAGVRLPDVTVPLATYTGWALRRGAQADDGCEGSGQMIPFAKTAASPGADPRQSVPERYPTYLDYYRKIVNAINDMVRDRLMLCEDVPAQLDRLVQAGLNAGVPAPVGAVPAAQFPACEPRKGRHDRDDDDDDDD